jgi:cytochrome d ubiquinol oxidase subunit I
MRTSDAGAPIAGGTVATSLVGFVVVYAVIFGAGAYYMLKLVREGPSTEPAPEQPSAEPAKKRAGRPMSLPDEGLA